MDSSTDQKWYAGGHLSSARMSEWVQASERDRLATSADFATAALKLKFGSLEAAMQKLGSMDNLRPYVVEMESCITASGVQPDSMTAAAWAEVLQNEKVSDIAAYCAARLKLPD